MEGARREFKAKHKIVLFFKKRNLQKESLKKNRRSSIQSSKPHRVRAGQGLALKHRSDNFLL